MCLFFFLHYINFCFIFKKFLSATIKKKMCGLLRRGTSRVAVCGARVSVRATGPVGHSVRSANGPDAQRTSPQGLAMPPLPRHQRRGGAGRTACSVKLIRLKSVWHCIVGACASRLQCCALSGLAALPRGELRKDCWECRSRRQMGTALV